MWETEHAHESAAAPEAIFALWAGGPCIVVSIEADGPDADQVGPAVAEDLPESVAALAAAAMRAEQPA